MATRQKTGGRTKATFFLAGAFVVAILVALAVLQIVKAYKKDIEAANKPPETIPVVVAKRNLYTGIQLTADDVVVRDITPQMVPQDTEGAQVFRSLEEVLGRTPRERILANEIIRGERLARRNAGEGLNAIITPGKRAMTIETDEASGLAGLLQPGNYVDVIVTLRPDDVSGRASYATETLLQGIQVLAVGSSLAPQEANKEATSGSRSNREATGRRTRSSATLELTLEEAEKLALASVRGELHLVLRSDVDITQQTTHGPVTASVVIGWDTAPKPTTPAATSTKPSKPSTPSTPEATTGVEIIQGSDVENVQYDSKGQKIQKKGR